MLPKKIDFKKENNNLYKMCKNKIEEITVPNLQFLTTHGEGDPNSSPNFQMACEALFSVSYKVKFNIKKSDIYPTEMKMRD